MWQGSEQAARFSGFVIANPLHFGWIGFTRSWHISAFFDLPA
jgi:hypothetical protein